MKYAWDIVREEFVERGHCANDGKKAENEADQMRAYVQGAAPNAQSSTRAASCESKNADALWDSAILTPGLPNRIMILRGQKRSNVSAGMHCARLSSHAVWSQTCERKDCTWVRVIDLYFGEEKLPKTVQVVLGILIAVIISNTHMQVAKWPRDEWYGDAKTS